MGMGIGMGMGMGRDGMGMGWDGAGWGWGRAARCLLGIVSVMSPRAAAHLDPVPRGFTIAPLACSIS
jgi:hypothetical protein